MRKIMATGTIAGALLLGGVAGSTLLSPVLANAASPTASPSAAATPTPTTTPSATTTPSTTTPSTLDDRGRGGHGPGGFGGRNEAVSDTSVAAAAIGISEADLTTALTSGQTIAAVAKAHNVDVQKVIDALVADGQSELAAAVKAGTLTQAQADAQQAEVTQRATDQVNGTFGMGGHGPGGFGGRNEAVSDTSVAAAAIGISEADLTTALTSGQTIAAVAKAHNVDVQKVIDALVADGQSELAAAVKAGTLTQAQADAQQAEVTQRATDQVNGTFGMGPGH